MLHKNAVPVNESFVNLSTGRLLAVSLPLQPSGRMGLMAASPTTVIHSRTVHFETSPPFTYGSSDAKRSTTDRSGAENHSTPPSTGSDNAPASSSSPRSWEAQ